MKYKKPKPKVVPGLFDNAAHSPQMILRPVHSEFEALRRQMLSKYQHEVMDLAVQTLHIYQNKYRAQLQTLLQFEEDFFIRRRDEFKEGLDAALVEANSKIEDIQPSS